MSTVPSPDATDADATEARVMPDGGDARPPLREDEQEPGGPPVRTSAPAPEVDPEDWTASAGGDDDRFLRERPPHW